MRALEKTLFVLSVAILSMLYGFAARSAGWFPDALLVRAFRQAEVLLPSSIPDHVAPRVYDRTGSRLLDSAGVQPGLTLISSVWEDTTSGTWRPGIELIDFEGRLHHRWLIDPATSFPDSARRRNRSLSQMDIHGAYLFPNGDVLVNVEYVGSARLDACGQVLWRLLEGNHHSVARADDGSFWIPGVTHLAPARSAERPDGFPGLADSVSHDLILHVSEHGEVLERIDILDVLYANRLERYIARSSNEGANYRQERRSDVTHLNDIEPLSASMADRYPLFDAGDLLVSLRHLDLVFVFDPETRRVKWLESDPFIHQHDPDFLGDGRIGVFDNNQDGTFRGDMLGGSRIVAFRPDADSMEILFPTPRSEPLYTRIRGKWQRLRNGNLLITEAMAGRVAEVAPDGHTVWDWVASPYNERAVPQVSEGTRYDLTAQDVASWPCSPYSDGS